MLIFKICCGQSSVEELLRQQQTIRAIYAKNPVNHNIPNSIHPFAKPYIQPKFEMTANGKHVKFVRPEKKISLDVNIKI